MLSNRLESELVHLGEELHEIEYKEVFAIIRVNTRFTNTLSTWAKFTFPLYRFALEQCDNCYIVCLTSFWMHYYMLGSFLLTYVLSTALLLSMNPCC